MEITIKLVLWLHLLTLALAGCTAFAVPAVLTLMRKAEPAQKPAFGQAMAKLSAMGRMALVLLIVTGVALIFVKHGSFAGLNGWFHAKMALVVAMVGLAVFNLRNAAWARAGDAAALARMPMLTKIAMALIALIVLCAVFAFN